MEFFHKKFKCENCGEEFKTKEELDEHMKVHMQPEQPQEPQQGSGEQESVQQDVSEKPEEEQGNVADSDNATEEVPQSPSEEPQQDQDNGQ